MSAQEMNNMRMIEKHLELAYEKASRNGELSERDEKLYKLMHDKAFIEKLKGGAKAGEINALLREKGVEFTDDEMKMMDETFNSIKAKMDEGNGELTEEELELVAGGFDWLTIVVIVVLVAIVAGSAIANFVEG